VQLAGFGYLVFAPEVYHAYEAPGTVLGYDDGRQNARQRPQGSLPPTAFDATPGRRSMPCATIPLVTAGWDVRI